VSYEREVPAVAFLECIKVHHVKLDRPCTVQFSLWWRQSVNERGVGIKRRREEVSPPPLKDAHRRAIVPTCMPHPAQARWVALDDNVLCGWGVLEILGDLCIKRD